jgi:hypothetical protein
MKFSNMEKGIALLWAIIFLTSWSFYFTKPTNILTLFLLGYSLPILMYISIKYIITGLRERKNKKA